jgi:hypothetical protein
MNLENLIDKPFNSINALNKFIIENNYIIDKVKYINLINFKFYKNINKVIFNDFIKYVNNIDKYCININLYKKYTYRYDRYFNIFKCLKTGNLVMMKDYHIYNSKYVLTVNAFIKLMIHSKIPIVSKMFNRYYKFINICNKYFRYIEIKKKSKTTNNILNISNLDLLLNNLELN